MENTIVKNEEPVFSEEMRAKIIEREKEIEKHPDDWADAFEALEELRKSI